MPYWATLDGADRLASASADFAAINARAGGTKGRPLASVPLATVVRLARRLGILVSRAVTIADGDVDLECWVRALPENGGVRLTLAPLRESAARRPPAAALGRPVPPPGAVWTWECDAALRVTRVALEAGARHGFDAAAALGRPLTQLFALEADNAGALPLTEAMADVRDFADQPARLRASGAQVTLAGTVRAGLSGDFDGFVGGTFAAESEPAAAEPSIAATFNARLERILRAPLGRIVAHADSISAGADGPIDAAYADYAADIASAGRHLLGLVDDLADLEAIEREDFRVDAEAIDLADVARRAAGLLAVRAADAEVTIARPDPEARVFARGEFRRTLQILVNLVGNAVRYAPAGSAVTVAVEAGAGGARAIVTDRGKGIAAADQETIFAKFGRVDPGEPGGSGLGLYIARRLARAMDGDLTVESTPGEGARFTLTLPA